MGNRGHKVQPLSVKQIRETAAVITDVFSVLGAKTSGARDIVGILDIHLPKLMPAFLLEILDDKELPNDYARTYPETALIQVRESVYTRARMGSGRDRFTLAHEMGHLFLHHEIIAYARSDSGHRRYEDSEWQADAFAAEFLMPFDEALRLQSAREIQSYFNVSEQAAQHRFDKIKRR